MVWYNLVVFIALPFNQILWINFHKSVCSGEPKKTVIVVTEALRTYQRAGKPLTITEMLDIFHIIVSAEQPLLRSYPEMSLLVIKKVHAPFRQYHVRHLYFAEACHLQIGEKDPGTLICINK